MADVPTGVTPATPQDQKAEESQKQNYATVEQFAEFTRQIHGISAALRKLQDQAVAQPATQTPAPAKQKADADYDAKLVAMESEVKALKEREERLKVRTFATLAREACAKLSVAPAALKPLVNHMRAKLGDRMILDDENGRIIVKPAPDRELLEQPQEFDGYLAAYLKGEGAWALPPKSLPVGGLPSKQSYVAPDGSHPFSRMTAKEIANHPDKTMFLDFITNHRDAWEAKKRALPIK